MAGAVSLSGSQRDADTPALAVNAQGDYLIAWAQNQLYGPFGVLSGSTKLSPSPGSVLSLAGDAASNALPAVAPDGTQALLWFMRSPSMAAISYGVEIATRAPGTSPWVTQRLSAPSDAISTDAQALAFGPQGQGAAAWTVRLGRTSEVMLSWRPPGGSFGPPQPVVRDSSGGDLFALGIDFDGAGRPTLVMNRSAVETGLTPLRRGRAAREIVHEAVQVAFGDTSGHFGGLQRVRRDCEIQDSDQAPSGAAVIAMTCGKGADGAQVRVSQRQPGQRFGPARVASGNGRHEFSPSLALSDDGHVNLAWLHRRSFDLSGHQSVRIQLADAHIGQPFSRPRPATPYDDQEPLNGIVEDPRGRPYLAWLGHDAALRLARITAANRLGHAFKLSPRNITGFDLAIDQTGRGIATWEVNRRRERIQASGFLAP